MAESNTFQKVVDKVFHVIRKVEDFLLYMWTGKPK